MLEGYFDLDGVKGPQVVENRKRLLAVQAAIEIAKASASSGNGVMHSDLDQATDRIAKLADAIQESLKY